MKAPLLPLLTWLANQGLVIKRAHALSLVESSLPISLHLLMGLGALSSCSALMGFFIAMQFMQYALASGLFFGSIAILVYHRFKKASPLWQSFFIQSALIFMISAKIFIIKGLLPYLTPYYPHYAITFSLLIVSLPTYFLFPHALYRWLSILALLISILYNMSFHSVNNLFSFIFFLSELTLIYFLLVGKNVASFLKPFHYALIVSLLLHSLVLTLVPITPTQLIVPIMGFNAALVIFLIALFLHLAPSPSSLQRLDLLAGGICLLLLTFIATPGILLALALLLIGYGFHERAFIILGVISLVLFVGFYYYILSVNLLHKSIILIANGGVLLIARFIMHWQKWDKKVQ